MKKKGYANAYPLFFDQSTLFNVSSFHFDFECDATPNPLLWSLGVCIPIIRDLVLAKNLAFILKLKNIANGILLTPSFDL